MVGHRYTKFFLWLGTVFLDIFGYGELFLGRIRSFGFPF